MRYLGLDYGKKRVGLAINIGATAFSHATIIRYSDERLLDDLKKIIDDEKIQAVVLGLALNDKGLLSPLAKETKAFATLLSSSLGVKVKFQNETLTTVEAGGYLKEMGIKPSQRKKRKDALAAQIILQEYLDNEE